MYVRVEEGACRERRAYPSDLTEAEWLLLEPLLPETKPRGQARVHSYREIINALLYRLSSGCKWRELPHDLPPYSTVATYFGRWRDSGLLERIHTELRQACREVVQEREPPFPAGILDSQSVKTTEVGGLRGYDGGKKSVGPQAAGGGQHRRLD
jgi:putative transposase